MVEQQEKKRKSRSKKSSSKDKSKSKSSKKQKTNSGAPENVNMDQNPIHIVEATDNFEALLSKVKKVNHLEYEEKAIRKAQRALKKAEANENEDEISDAKLTLQMALDDKEEAALWLEPSKALIKLNERLAEQIEKGEPQEAIEETK